MINKKLFKQLNYGEKNSKADEKLLFYNNSHTLDRALEWVKLHNIGFRLPFDCFFFLLIFLFNSRELKAEEGDIYFHTD